jgi:hypothetical protein
MRAPASRTGRATKQSQSDHTETAAHTRRFAPVGRLASPQTVRLAMTNQTLSR